MKVSVHPIEFKDSLFFSQNNHITLAGSCICFAQYAFGHKLHVLTE